MKKHNTKLIAGDFSPPKARTILLGLLSYKIDFHEMEQFSNKMRFAEDIEHSEKRIKELRQERDELVLWFKTIENESTIKIECNIVMEA